MSKTMKKLLALVLAMVTLMSMAACVPSAEGPSTEGTIPTVATNPTNDEGKTLWNVGSLPIVNEPVTLKILCVDQAGYKFDKAAESGLWDYIKEKTGITIEVESYSAEDMATKLPLIMADPSSMPDIFLGVNFTEADIMNYGQNGQILCMDDYIEKLCPNIKEWMNTVEYAKGACISTDGHIYSLPKDNGVGGISITTYSMNSNWLKALNRENPKTLEELGEILALIDQTDMNGDGQLNEYGISGTWKNLKRVLLAWVGLDCYWPWEGFLVDADENGKVFSAISSNQAKYLLQTLNAWYEAGYIDPNLWTQSGSELKANRQNNLYFLVDGHMNAADGDPEGSVYYAPFTSAVHDTPIITCSAPYQTAIGAVAANTKYPEVCMLLLDWLFSEDGSKVANFGLEGVDYNVVDKDKWILESVGKDEGFATVGKYLTGYFTVGWTRDEWAQPRVNAYQAQRDEAQSAYYTPAFQNYLKLNEEESEVINTYSADLGLYMDDMFVGFITGKYDIDTDWTAFINNCQKMGETELVAAYQSAYDRYMGK